MLFNQSESKIKITSCHHLGQCLLLGLSLSCQLGAAVTKPGDVVLHVRYLILLPVILLHLQQSEISFVLCQPIRDEYCLV